MKKLDFFDSRYFRINKILLKMLGAWPYQNATVKFAIKFAVSIAHIITVIPQFICLRQYLGVNPDRAIQAFATGSFYLANLLKLTAAIVAEKKMQNVYENMVDNYQLLKNQTERDVLLRYSEIGRYLTIGYVAYMCSAVIGYTMVPLVPVIMDFVIPINESRDHIFILEGEYGIDKIENYGKIYIFEVFCCFVPGIIFMPLDTTYVVCVEQCIGLLAVVELRLQLATTKRSDINDKSINEDNTSYCAMVDCIKLHKNALHFWKILEGSYSISFFVILAANVIVLSGMSVVVLINLHQPIQLIRFLMCIAGLFIHMFYLSWPGQKLIDISSQLCETTYMNEWYNLSMKTKKLLRFMLLKVQKPLVLSAGKFYIMNLANFGVLTRTTVSYITIFLSFRKDS